MKRLELLNALKIVMPGIGDSDMLIDGADSFIFDIDWIKTFNDEISVSFPFETGLKCLVKAKEFYQVLSKIESEEIELQLINDKLHLNSKKTILKMTTLDASALSSLIDNLALENISQWESLHDQFLYALNICSQFSSSNPAFPSLCVISVDSDGIMASDRSKASFYHVPIKATHFMIKNESIKELVKFTNITQFAIEKSWIHFKTKDNGYFSIRKYGSDFPRNEIKNYMNYTDVSQEYLFPEELEKSIERASILVSSTQDGEKYISLSLNEKGDLIILGSRELGEIKEIISKNDNWSFPKNVIVQIDPSCLLSLLTIGRKFFIKDNQFLLMKNGNLESISALIIE